MEMETDRYILGISSVFDTEEGMKRLSSAMKRIDCHFVRKTRRKSYDKIVIKENEKFQKAIQKLKISEAMDSPMKTIPLSQSEGAVSGEFVYLYPPGIPLIAPGEVITREILDNLEKYKMQGLKVQGMMDLKGKMIKIVQ